MECELFIDDQLFKYDVEGEFTYGMDELLIEKDRNAIEYTEWSKAGYSVENLLTSDQFYTLKENLQHVLNNIIDELGLRKPDNLEQYHTVINSQPKHQSVIEKTRLLTKRDFNIDLEKICEKVSDLLGKKVAIFNPKLKEEIITLRISRPNSMDINPLHRDAYLDFYKDTVNLWFPIVGCNELSSLPIIPGSHYWRESDVLKTKPKGATIQGLNYNVPGIVKGPEILKAIRPNPNYGQALVFSPYLIHGSAINLNKDITRMALELRPCLQ